MESVDRGREVMMTCPLCGASQQRFLFNAHDRFHHVPGSFMVLECQCGLRLTWPQPDDIARYYPAGYYAYGPVGPPPFFGRGLKGTLRSVVLRYHYGYRYGLLGERLPERGWVATMLYWLSLPLRRRAALVFGPGPLPLVQRGGRILDVGCGNGAWLLKMRSLGWDVEGVEVSPLGCKMARAAGLTIYQGELAEAARPPASYDVVRIWHTLEHVPDPRAVLDEVVRILKPGGLVLIGVPNAGGWMARIWRSLWFDLDVPRHLWHFKAPILRHLAEDAGLHVVALRHGFYGGYSLLRSFSYLAEQWFGYTPARRTRFERGLQWLRQARSAFPVRLLLRPFERTNHLELTAMKPPTL